MKKPLFLFLMASVLVFLSSCSNKQLRPEKAELFDSSNDSLILLSLKTSQKNIHFGKSFILALSPFEENEGLVKVFFSKFKTANIVEKDINSNNFYQKKYYLLKVPAGNYIFSEYLNTANLKTGSTASFYSCLLGKTYSFQAHKSKIIYVGDYEIVGNSKNYYQGIKLSGYDKASAEKFISQNTNLEESLYTEKPIATSFNAASCP